MKKRYSRILLALVIIAAIGSAFPYLKKTVEIRSETRKWVEKWEDRVATSSYASLPELAKANKVPEEVKQDLELLTECVAGAAQVDESAGLQSVRLSRPSSSASPSKVSSALIRP